MNKNILVKYTFHPHSIKGLKDCVEIYEHTFEEARRRILKCIYLGKTKEHLQKCVDEGDPWRSYHE